MKQLALRKETLVKKSFSLNLYDTKKPEGLMMTLTLQLKNIEKQSITPLIHSKNRQRFS